MAVETKTVPAEIRNKVKEYIDDNYITITMLQKGANVCYRTWKRFNEGHPISKSKINNILKYCKLI